jgi:L-iditol 2-dehydrogenase
MNGVTIHTIRGEGHGAVARAMTLAAQGRLVTSSLITHHFALDKIADAFDTYRRRDGDAMKVMIDVGAG